MSDPIKQAMASLREARAWFSDNGPLAQRLDAALSALQQAVPAVPEATKYAIGTVTVVGAINLDDGTRMGAVVEMTDGDVSGVRFGDIWDRRVALVPVEHLAALQPQASAPAVPEGCIDGLTGEIMALFVGWDGEDADLLRADVWAAIRNRLDDTATPPSDHPADVKTSGNGSGSPALRKALEDVRRHGEQYGKKQED